jgi:hypothetical protein
MEKFTMPPELIWNAILTAVLGLFGWVIKTYAEEVQRLQVLLNRTREDMAREYATKAEVHNDSNRVMLRLEALDAKIDRLLDRLVERTNK